MLVLSRKTRQQILIGDNITVTILLVKGQVVRVGIEAPRDVRVLRAELPVFEDPAPAKPASPRAKPRRVTGASGEGRPPVAQASASRLDDGASRTSPGLLDLRRRGRLSSLARPAKCPTATALRPLFQSH